MHNESNRGTKESDNRQIRKSSVIDYFTSSTNITSLRFLGKGELEFVARTLGEKLANHQQHRQHSEHVRTEAVALTGNHTSRLQRDRKFTKDATE